MGDLQSHGRPETAFEELAFQGPDEIVDFLRIHVEVAVASHPELIAAINGQAREEFVHEGVDDRGEKNEVSSAGALKLGG